MESKKVLLIMVALMVIHGTVLAFGSKNQNSVASVSILEMWHPSKCSIVACADTTQDALTKADLETLGSFTDDLFALQMLWRYMNESCLSKEDSILKSFSVTREVVDEIGFQSVDLIDKQIRFGITDAQIIKWTQTMIPFDDSLGSTNELIAPRKLYQCLDETAIEWIQSMAPLASNDTACSTKDLIELQRICHCIDARVCSQLSVESDNQTTRILMSLHRICRYIDTAIYHLLGGKLVILDTDIGSSTDDMFALQMLCRYMDAGKCRLLGVIVDRKGLDNARMAKYQLAYLGPSEVPVGIVNDYPENVEPFIDYPSLFKHKYPVNDSTDVIDAKDLYRQLLAGAPDKGVEIICVGFMTALSSLLTSQPDAISSLSGVELVEKKVQRVYIMGSDFTENNYSVKPGYNLDTLSPAYADTVFRLLPSSVEIMFSPGEVGEEIKYENDSVLKDIKDHDNPLWPIYDESNGVVVDSGQFMWDVLPVIQCIEGDEHFHLSEPGHVRMGTDDKGNNLIIFAPDKSGNARFQYIPSEWKDKKKQNPEELQRFKDYVLWLIKQSHQKGSSFQAEKTQPTSQRKSIVILYVSDVHCEIFGYPIMAGYRDAVSDTAYVATVEIGDFLQGGTVGAISEGSYIAVIICGMNHVVVMVGNHEFDFGMKRQHDLLDTINAPVVCANLYDMQGNRIYSPYVIKSYGDQKVAFVGVLTAYTEEIKSSEFYTTDGQKIYDLRRDKMKEIVQQSVNDARAEGANYVVLLSHVGEVKQQEGCLTSEELVMATTGIDVVLDGHSHVVVPCDTVKNAAGESVYITQTGKKFANIGKLVISPKGDINVELIPTKSIPYRNARVAHITDSINALVDSSTAHTVFHTDFDLTINDKNGVKAETNAGDIVTDAMRSGLKTDIAFVNDGGLREKIDSGDVSYRQVCDLALFTDNVVKIQASGAEILEMLRCSTQDLQSDDEFPHVSGMKFSVRVSDHTITSAEVLQPDGSGVSMDPAAIYTVAILEYATHTGFHKSFAKCRPVLENSGILYRDMLVDYINEVYGGNVPAKYAKPQGRITIE